MNDERLTGLLGSLRYERMDRVADDRIRARLEHAWTARQRERSLSWRARRLAPLLATLALFVGLAAATMNAGGDSALYGARVAVEDALVVLRSDPQGRADYLLALLDQRQAEAARLESSGNAAAAGRVRAIEQRTLDLVRAILPEAPDLQPEVVAPEPTESPSPTPSPTSSPSPSPSPSPVPTPATTRPATPRPAATATPRPATATPKPATATPVPTGTLMAVKFSGKVRNPDLTLADNVCVRLDPNSATCLTKTVQGAYSVTASARMNQTVTIYFTRLDGTILYKAYVSAVVKSATVTMPDAKLAK